MADLPSKLIMKKLTFWLFAGILTIAILIILNHRASNPETAEKSTQLPKDLRSESSILGIPSDRAEPEPSLYSLGGESPPVPKKWIEDARKASKSEFSN